MYLLNDYKVGLSCLVIGMQDLSEEARFRGLKGVHNV